MSTISDLLSKDPLSRFEYELARASVYTRFESFPPDTLSDRAVGALHPFASERPWCYWDTDLVQMALDLLEDNRNRTIEAIRARSLY